MVSRTTALCLLDIQSAIVRDPILLSPDTPVSEAIARMNAAQSKGTHALDCEVRSSCVLVTEGTQLVGLFTEQEVVRWVATQSSLEPASLNTVTLRQVMTPPGVTLYESACTDGAMTLNLLQKHSACHIPVLDEQGYPVGLMTHNSVLQALSTDELSNCKRTEVHLEAQNALLAKIAQDVPLLEVLHGLIEFIEHQCQGALCSILLLDEENRLRLGAAPNLPPGYNCAVDGVPMGEGEGSCGTAAFRRETVIVTDIAQHPFWQNYKALALQYGLKACWSSPILASDGRVLGTFAVYYQAVRSPEAFELELLGQVANIAGIAIERTQSAAALRESQAKFHRLVDNVPGIIYRYLLHPDGRDEFTFLSPYVQDLLGIAPDAIIQNSSLFWSKVPAEDIPQVTQQATRSLTDGSPFFSEFRILSPDGSLKWLQAISRPERLDSGDVLWDGVMLDISDRKQAEQEILNLNQALEAKIERRTAALLEKQHFIEQVTDSTTAILYIYDLLAQENVYSNGQITKVLGYSPETIRAMGNNLFANLVHPEDLPAILARVGECLTAEDTEILEVEYRMRHANGEWRWIQSRDRVFRRTVEGAPWQMLGTAVDITTRKQAEAEMRDMSIALSNAVEGISRLDEHGRYLFVNEAYARLAGYRPEEMIGMNWQRTVHPDDIEPLTVAFQHMLQEGKVETEARGIRKDGSVFHKQLFMMVAYTEQKQRSGHYCFMKDISDRKQFEQQLQQLNQQLEHKVAERTAKLQEREQFLQTVLDTFPLSVFWKNRASSYLGCNRNFLRDIGFQSVEDLIGKTDYDLPWCKAEADACRADDRQVMETNIAKLGIIETLQTVDGSQIWIETNKLPLHDLNGAVVGVLGTYQNISEKVQIEAERRQAEAQLQQTNAELARVTHLKDEFLANMSHELRTPLNAVLGMTEGLQEGIFGEINPAQLKALQTIERSGSHLLELINDILDLAKVESGRIELERTATAIAPLCRASISFIKQQALKKCIQLDLKLPPTLPNLWVDERRIRQVLINLLSNAVKFTPEAGSILLEVSPYQTSSFSELAADESQNFLHIAIIDTGIGIAPEHLATLFQPFIQIDSALNRKYSGTGLGLALVKRIVELHGGQVEVTSEVGVGSTFAIILPCAPTVLSTEPDSPICIEGRPYSLIPQSSPLILLAEDNDANISTLSSYLRAKGYRLLVAKTGHAAIALAQAENPDLILMDVQMPEMDGLEAIGRLRQDSNFADVPVIALTGLAMTGDRERCLAAGANSYLSKPVKLKELTLTIQQLLSAQAKLQ